MVKVINHREEHTAISLFVLALFGLRYFDTQKKTLSTLTRYRFLTVTASEIGQYVFFTRARLRCRRSPFTDCPKASP